MEIAQLALHNVYEYMDAATCSIFIFYVNIFILINIKPITLGSALWLCCQFIVLPSCMTHAAILESMSWTLSITVKPPYYPDTISWGFTWISKLESETRLNTALVRIVPEDGPNESVVETLKAKQKAFWMGCCSKKTNCAPGKESQTLNSFLICLHFVWYYCLCVLTVYGTLADRVFIYWRSLSPG